MVSDRTTGVPLARALDEGTARTVARLLARHPIGTYTHIMPALMGASEWDGSPAALHRPDDDMVTIQVHHAGGPADHLEALGVPAPAYGRRAPPRTPNRCSTKEATESKGSPTPHSCLATRCSRFRPARELRTRRDSADWAVRRAHQINGPLARPPPPRGLAVADRAARLTSCAMISRTAPSLTRWSLTKCRRGPLRPS